MEMTSENTLFIVRNGDGWTEYGVAFDHERPRLLRTPLTQLLPEQQPLLCRWRAPATGAPALPGHLRYITVINSVNSGAGMSNSYYFNVLMPIFNEFGIPHVCVATTSASSVSDHAESFSTSGTVLLFGGDTTVSEFVNGLPANGLAQLRIIVIPTGSGNALANSIGLGSPVDAIRSIFCGERTFKPLTVLPVSYPGVRRCSLVVVSLGLHAGLVGDADTPEMRKLGNERFKEAARALVERDPSYLAEVPGIETTTHSYLLITPVRELEAGFTISPHGSPPDGKAAYMVRIEKVGGPRFMEIMGAAYNMGEHIHCNEVTYKRLEGPLKILVPDQPELERRCCIDGTVVVLPPGVVEIGDPGVTWRGWELLILA